MNKIAIVTGAASGIGKAITIKLINEGYKVGCVDASRDVASLTGDTSLTFAGDVTDADFRKTVFDLMTEKWGIPTVCVPAAGITRDGLAVKINKETKKAEIYNQELFEKVLAVNLIAPTYWGMEMVARLAEANGKWQPGTELRGTVVLIGSVSSLGNRGQVAYSASKKALEAVAATLTSEGMFYGVCFKVVHPGFCDTPMVAKVPQEYLEKNVLPCTQLKRLLQPEEVANAVYFMITNPGVTGELWVDAGWHPIA